MPEQMGNRLAVLIRGQKVEGQFYREEIQGVLHAAKITFSPQLRKTAVKRRGEWVADICASG
jgi:hypothetical protein